MRKSFTAVVERNVTFTESFATEPYECGWASEARWFVRSLEVSGDEVALSIYPQISPDGLHWCDEGSAPLTVRAPGLVSLKLRDFGQWLRLRGELTGRDPSVKVIVYLALKE